MAARHPSIRDLFGTRIRVLRDRVGLTQEKLAFRAGMDRSYIGQVERGEVNVSIDNIAKIAKGLRVQPAKLFEFADVGVDGR